SLVSLVVVFTFASRFSFAWFPFVLPIQLPPVSPLFPYTTLFRSVSISSVRTATADAASVVRLKPGKSHHTSLAVALLVLGDEMRSEEHTSELQSRFDLVCRLLLEKKNLVQEHP